jgi:hypothetical protein
MGTEVRYGWIIRDQAAVVQGLGFGPSWLAGSNRQGPVHPGYHNLIGKDIVFQGKGKHALDAIVKAMVALPRVKVRCGIRPGMMIEKFEESEYGGGMDEVRVMATEADIQRMKYHVHVFPDEPGAYAFSSLLTNFVAQATGFASVSSGVGAMARGVFESGVTLHDKIKPMVSASRSPLQKALASDKVIVLLTGETRRTSPVASHSHTHSMPTIAKDIIGAVMKGA